MPRPSSKIMSTAADVPATDDSTPTAADTPAVPVRAPRQAKPKGNAALVTVLSRAERKQRAQELLASIKTSREPLTAVENELRELGKTKAAAAKALSEAQKAYDKALKAHDKSFAALDKKRVKFSDAFDKARAKIDAEIAALKS